MKDKIQHEHVESLTRWEWTWFAMLLVPMACLMSFNAMYMGFKVGQFDSNGSIAMVLVWPLIVKLVCRNNRGRAFHVANHFQTGVSGAAASVGMGSMLLAYQWATGTTLTGFEVACVAFPMSLFGVYSAQLFGELMINRQKLTFPGGVAAAGLLTGLAEGGQAFKLLLAGVTIALPLTVWESPYGAALVAAGWIIGWEVSLWAMLTAVLLQSLEPTLKAGGFIANGYRDVSVYLGAVVVLTAGFVDLFFVLFAKSGEGDNPHFNERTGFMPRKSNLLTLFGLAALMSVSAQVVFGLPWYMTMGVCGLTVFSVYVGATCSGKAGLGPVSALSGIKILLAILFGFTPGQSLIYGAGAGQALSNGFDGVNDLRAGERVGSSLRLQRITQVMGAALGGSVIVGAMYAFFMAAFGSQLTKQAISVADPKFNAGFAVKYEGFTHLLQKLQSIDGLGTLCIWVAVATALLSALKNILNSRGKHQLSRFVPSLYGCAMAAFIPFAAVKQEMLGGIILFGLLLVWKRMGTMPATVDISLPEAVKREDRVFFGLRWKDMICIPCGLGVGEAIVSFIDGSMNIAGLEGLVVGDAAGISKYVVIGIVVIAVSVVATTLFFKRRRYIF